MGRWLDRAARGTSSLRDGLAWSEQGVSPHALLCLLDDAARPDRKAISATGDRDERMRRVESILFLAREPLTSRRVSEFANLADATEARTLIRQLNELLDRRGYAFRVEEVAGGYQMMTRPVFARWIGRLQFVPGEERLSGPALETLAVVAYRQPVARAEIEAIRGVSCGEILRQLMDRDLVRLRGRSPELGRPYLYGTTKRFLQLFGLRSLECLPRAADLRRGLTVTGSSKAKAGSERKNEEESDVSTTITSHVIAEETLEQTVNDLPVLAPRCSDEDDDFGEFDDFDDDEDEFDDEDDDFDDFDDFDDEDEDDDFDDDDEFEDDWEEVEDDDVDWEDDDDFDEEDDWEDDDDWE